MLERLKKGGSGNDDVRVNDGRLKLGKGREDLSLYNRSCFGLQAYGEDF